MSIIMLSLEDASNEKSNKSGSDIISTVNSESKDYTQYIGVWVDEEHMSSDNVSQTGGRKIEVCKVQGDKVF